LVEDVEGGVGDLPLLGWALVDAVEGLEEDAVDYELKIGLEAERGVGGAQA